MGSVFSTPADSEQKQHHRHHHRHHHSEENDEIEENENENDAEISEKSNSTQKENRKRKLPKINKAFIPETIDDAAEGEPMGLYVDGVTYQWETEKFKKFLTKNGITFDYAKKKKSKHFATIYFKNNQDRANAYKILTKLGEEGVRQFFVVALEKPMTISEQKCQRLQKRATSNLDTRDIDDRISPWHSIPYDEQLKRKADKFTKILSPIIPDPETPITVYPAPKLEGYRNNVELTIGRDLEGKICVGFNLGSRVEDIIAPIKSTFSCPERAPELAEKIRQFVVDSGVPIFDRITHTGHWKFVSIRSNEANEVMLMMVIYKTIEQEIVDSFKEAFENEVDSLYFCETESFESLGQNPVLKHLSGKEYLIETLRGLQFEISPMSFFQTNTPGAEVLFQKIEEIADVDENTVLIDVCCGTGVIGLALARKAKFVVGVDIVEQAVEDAKRNAERNGITNTEYIADKAENAMPLILEKYAVNGQRVVAICDPPRGGLVKKALNSLRNCEMLKRIVYISCEADSLVQNARKCLFNERDTRTKPFYPTNYFGVDMFPHTDRCEIVMLMERE